MLSKWPIRNKLLLGLALLLVIVGTLSYSGLYGLYAYRGLLKNLARVAELPLATDLGRRASDLRVAALSQPPQLAAFMSGRDSTPSMVLYRADVEGKLSAARDSLEAYRDQLRMNRRQETFIGDSRSEWETVGQIAATLDSIERAVEQGESTRRLDVRLGRLQDLVEGLPGYLHEKINRFPDQVRSEYRRGLGVVWITTPATAILLGAFVWLMYRWVFRPLRLLVKGSRKVAAGAFHARIRLHTADEMGELAEAMNRMTDRFREIHDDLDKKAQEGAAQVVRSVQLASVGFLAAGVAHDVNAPLVRIVKAADSLKRRLDEANGDPENRKRAVLEELRRIQQEAFHCKDITQNLLDFSRRGDAERKSVDLRELAGGVIDIVGHVGKYQRKRIELAPGEAVYAEVNVQEARHVILSLLVKALDDLGADGRVEVRLRKIEDRAELSVRYAGRGMSPAELKKLFDASSACRDGQPAGLGLSVSQDIVEDHGGYLRAESEGPGRGAEFRVGWPLSQAAPERERDHRHFQAA